MVRPELQEQKQGEELPKLQESKGRVRRVVSTSQAWRMGSDDGHPVGEGTAEGLSTGSVREDGIPESRCRVFLCGAGSLALGLITQSMHVTLLL